MTSPPSPAEQAGGSVLAASRPRRHANRRFSRLEERGGFSEIRVPPSSALAATAALVAGGLALVGSVLPWAELDNPGQAALKGIAGDGALTLVIGAVLLVTAICIVLARSFFALRVSLAATALAACAACLAVAEQDYDNISSGFLSDFRVVGGAGGGLKMVLYGSMLGVMALAGSLLLMWRDATREQSRG